MHGITGCIGFSAVRGYVSAADQEGLIDLVGSTPEKYKNISTLTRKAEVCC